MTDTGLIIEIQDASGGGARVPPKELFTKWILLAFPADAKGELTIRVVAAAESADLNQKYREKRGPTNILSFPAELYAPTEVEKVSEGAEGDAPDGTSDGEPRDFGSDVLPIGDLVICASVLSREAQEQRKPLEAHWAHIVIHGALHLQGFDHETDEQAAVMEGRERDLLATLGFRDPYSVQN